MENLSGLINQIDESTSARDKILFTAHDLFYQEGIRATGIDRIIARSSVTKTTFYRHFPSKNNLIIEYLELRHKKLVDLLRERLQHFGGSVDAICPTLREWFNSANFRGCAFINSVAELGTELPEIVSITRQHKNDVVDIILSVLPQTPDATEIASALSLAIEGTIVKVQYEQNVEFALKSLGQIIKLLVQGSTKEGRY